MTSTKKRTSRAKASKRATKKTGDLGSMPAGVKNKGGPPTGKSIRYLRGLGHHLDPIVQVGKEGITDALVTATKRALLDHELVKVRVGAEAPIDRKEVGTLLAEATSALLAQTLGRTLLLYRRHPSEPKIVLPR